MTDQRHALIDTKHVANSRSIIREFPILSQINPCIKRHKISLCYVVIAH